MPTHISLPNERVEQLRMIARAKNQTIPEVIADFVRAEIAKGTIPDALPGISVERCRDEVNLKTTSGIDVTIPAHIGNVFADLLRDVSRMKVFGPEERKRWLEGTLNLTGVSVKRAGNGLKLISPVTGKEFSMNLDVAFDLASQVEKAAK